MTLSVVALRNIATGMFFLLGLYFVYLLFWPFPTLAPRVQPYRVLTPVVHIGEAVIYEANYCKYTDATATVTRNMVSDTGVVISLPTTSTNLPPGCHITQSATTVIPAATPPGRYKLQVSVAYHINALRDITKNVETDYFTVAPTP
jgi:hypothetical protein